MPFHEQYVPPSWDNVNNQPKGNTPSAEELKAHDLPPGSSWEDLQDKIRKEDGQLPQAELEKRLFEQRGNKAA